MWNEKRIHRKLWLYGTLALLALALLTGCASVRYGNRRVRGAILVIPARADTTIPDLFVINWNPSADSNSDTETFYSTYLTGAEHTVLWEQKFDQFDMWYFPHAASDDHAVYYVAGQRLLALDRVDGALLWEAGLSDIVNTSCPTCLEAVGERVIVLTTDYILSAFDRDTGAPAWSLRLNDSSTARNGFQVVDETLILADEVASDTSRWAVQRIAPESGELIQTIAPTCPRADDRLYLYGDQIFLETGLGSAYQALFLYECNNTDYMQSRSLRTGELAWETTLPEGFNPSHNAAVLGSDTLYLQDYEAVFGVSLASGHVRQLPQATDPDYDVTLLDEGNELLLAWVRRTRGTTRYALWGLTPAGEQLWSYALTSDDNPATLTNATDWAYRLVDQGVLLIEVRDDPAHIVVTLLDPQSGQVLQQTTQEIDYVSTTSLTWERATAYLATGGHLYAIDLQTLAISPVWP